MNYLLTFEGLANPLEKTVWQSFKNTCFIFLGNHKAQNYRDTVADLLNPYKTYGMQHVFKNSLQASRLDFFPENLGALSDEHAKLFRQ